MFNLRYILRLIGAFINRFKFLISLGIFVGIIFFFVLKFIIPKFISSQTSRIGMVGRYTTTNLPDYILQKVSNGLTKLSSDGTPEPDLATSWETPDKGKTWIFTLKDNVNWQDGKKVTSSTISYQFSDVQVERPNSKTIIFKLQTSYSAFPSVVAKPTFKSGLLGTGDYRVTSMTMNGSIIENLVLQKKNEEKIIYKFYPTEERLKLAFELGEVDQIIDILDPSSFNSWPKIKIASESNLGEYVAIFFNVQDKTLSDKGLRQALSYAINKDNFPGERAISPISIESWAYNPQVKPYDYDMAKAKSMIQDYEKTNKVSDISITLSTTQVLLNQAEMIAKDWQAAGVNCQVVVVSQIPSDYQAFLVIFDTPSDPDQYSMWHSTQTLTNISHYQDPRIDKLLEDGRSEIDIESRKKTYLDFQRFLIEDSPAAFLYYPITYSISRR